MAHQNKTRRPKTAKDKLGTALLVLGVICIAYFLGLNYYGRLQQQLSYWMYERRLEQYGDTVQDSDEFFSFDSLPSFLFIGQSLISSEQTPVAGIEELESESVEEHTPDWNTGPIDYTERIDYQSNNMVLVVPRMSVKAGVFNGVSATQLKKGPGLYDQSDLPSENGTVIIAAHRDVFGAWFYHIDKLKMGDKIRIQFNGMIYVYTYESTQVVEKNDWSAVEKKDYGAVILSSCTPLGTSRQRIVVTGRLSEILPNE